MSINEGLSKCWSSKWRERQGGAKNTEKKQVQLSEMKTAKRHGEEWCEGEEGKSKILGKNGRLKKKYWEKDCHIMKNVSKIRWM